MLTCHVRCHLIIIFVEHTCTHKWKKKKKKRMWIVDVADCRQPSPYLSRTACNCYWLFTFFDDMRDNGTHWLFFYYSPSLSTVHLSFPFSLSLSFSLLWVHLFLSSIDCSPSPMIRNPMDLVFHQSTSAIIVRYVDNPNWTQNGERERERERITCDRVSSHYHEICQQPVIQEIMKERKSVKHS